jgi:hypothetical protein
MTLLLLFRPSEATVTVTGIKEYVKIQRVTRDSMRHPDQRLGYVSRGRDRP